MKLATSCLACLLSFCAHAQTGVYAYKTDNVQFFKLKSVRVESTVIGPIVRTSTDLIYDNPFQSMAEVSLKFALPQTAALGGFAYFYGDHYVDGRLMDKSGNQLVHTGTGIHDQNPAVLDQELPMAYHCKIFRIKPCSDLRVRLWTDGMVQPAGEKMVLPKPSVEVPLEPNTSCWSARSVQSRTLRAFGDNYSVGKAQPMTAVAQLFSDGRYYVAGYVHIPHAGAPSIEVEHAYYEPASGQPGGADVTAKVDQMVRESQFSIWASDTTFGDPCPYVVKRLRVVAKFGDEEKTIITPESETMNLFGQGGNSVPPAFSGLEEPKTVFEDAGTVAFSGWTRKPGTITAIFQGHEFKTYLKDVPKGSDAARLWAQQMLATNAIHESKEVAVFSLKYGVPSDQTDLVAIPSGQVQRYINGGGETFNGESEIRFEIHGAERVQARVPNGLMLSLVPNGDLWRADYTFPDQTLTGAYKVEVTATMPGGKTLERDLTYHVKHSPPVGGIALVVEHGSTYLKVTSEPKLAEVAVYGDGGKKQVLPEVAPGIYWAPEQWSPTKVELIDSDRNIGGVNLTALYRPE